MEKPFLLYAPHTFQSDASFSLASSFFFNSATAGSSACWLSDAGWASASPSFFPASCDSFAASLYHLAAAGCIVRTVMGLMKVWGRDSGF